MSWPTKKLFEVAAIERHSISPENIQNGTFYVGLEHITSEGSFIGIEPVTKGKLHSSKFVFSSEHLLYGKLRPYLRKIARPSFDGICSTDILPIRVKKVEIGYLFHYLRTSQVVEYASTRATGVNLPRLSPKVLANLDIPLPPLSEQKRIAAILDKADALREKRRQAIAKLDELLQSVFLDMFGDPVTNPKGWNTTECIDLCQTADDIKCGPFGTQLAQSEFRTNGIPLWGIKHVNAGFSYPTVEFVSEEKAKKLAPYSIEKEDLVMTRKGTVGNCAVYPNEFTKGIMHSDLLRIRLDRNCCTPYFLRDQLRFSQAVQHQIKVMSSGAVMAGINVAKLKKLKVLVPPIPLQEKYTIIVAKRLALISSLWQNSLEKLDNLFSYLQHRAFKGEL